MKNILIIYSHWPPSNLAGVHRSRLISNFLLEFDWQPIILTVHEDFYEEELDYDFLKTVRDTTEVIKVSAKPVKSKKRLIGDITLRAFKQLKEKAIEIINSRKIDFVWVPIPSFYTAIVARKVYNKTHVPYGIDYIDPWVDSFVGQENIFSKAWISNQAAKLLEPYSVKKASLISGVSKSYYQSVLERNFKNKEVLDVGMPYGFDPLDHQIELDNIDLPWAADTKALVYAGAFLPKSHLFLCHFFEVIKEMKQNGVWDDKRKLYFLGTGNYPGKTIAEYATEYSLEDIVIEIPERFPFLQILYFLTKAEAVLVIGSTEEHYTASKIFQSLLSKRPVFAIFHHKSSAVKIMQEAEADNYLVKYCCDNKSFTNDIEEKFQSLLKDEAWKPNLKHLDKYSAKASARALVNEINKVADDKRK